MTKLTLLEFRRDFLDGNLLKTTEFTILDNMVQWMTPMISGLYEWQLTYLAYQSPLTALDARFFRGISWHLIAKVDKRQSCANKQLFHISITLESMWRNAAYRQSCIRLNIVRTRLRTFEALFGLLFTNAKVKKNVPLLKKLVICLNI